MKIYLFAGYATLVLYALACIFLAPPHIGPWAGLSVGVAYLVVCWFFAGLYLSSVIHMGIAHRALDYKEWFVKSLTLVNNAFGVYVDPITWVNRHRLHHSLPTMPATLTSSRRRLLEDLVPVLSPYKTDVELANDAILHLADAPGGEPRVLRGGPGRQLLLLWWLVGSLPSRGAVGRYAPVRAVGQHGPELLDPRTAVRHTAATTTTTTR